MKKESLIIAVSSIALSTTSQAFILLPTTDSDQQTTYNHAYKILEHEGAIEYGQPISIQVNEEAATLDISDLNSLVVRVPLDKVLLQPNRTDPTQHHE